MTTKQQSGTPRLTDEQILPKSPLNDSILDDVDIAALANFQIAHFLEDSRLEPITLAENKAMHSSGYRQSLWNDENGSPVVVRARNMNVQ